MHKTDESLFRIAVIQLCLGAMLLRCPQSHSNNKDSTGVFTPGVPFISVLEFFQKMFVSFSHLVLRSKVKEGRDGRTPWICETFQADFQVSRNSSPSKIRWTKETV